MLHNTKKQYLCRVIFHSIRFKVNKKIGSQAWLPFFLLIFEKKSEESFIQITGEAFE